MNKYIGVIFILLPGFFASERAGGQYQGAVSDPVFESAKVASLAVSHTIHGFCGATEEFSATNGHHSAVLNENLVVTLTDWADTGYNSSMVIYFTQDETGGHTVTWPAEVSRTPDINPAPNSITTVILSTTDNGGHIFAHSDYSTEAFSFTLSDETTPLVVSAGVASWRAPFPCYIVDVRASLKTASSDGVVEVDVKEDGSTIFSTPLTIDESETTSKTAAVPAVISDHEIADDAVVTFDITGNGLDATGLKVTLYLFRP